MRKSRWFLLVAVFLVIFGKQRSLASADCVDTQDLTGGKCLTSDCEASCTSFSDRRVSITVPGHEHLSYLIHTTKIASEIDPGVGEELCKQLFSLAFTLPMSWDRIATEKNALIPLSTINPDLSMALFAKVEKPQPDPAGTFPEDVRADAATGIFLNYWKTAGLEGLPTIEKMARHIGDTGEYPYRAVGLILAELAKSHQKELHARINLLFQEAVRYYQKGSKFLNRDAEFLDFLRNARHGASKPQFLHALHVFVERLTSEPPEYDHYVAEIGTSRGVSRFENQNHALLFQTMSLILGVNRNWAAELMALYPELKGADAPIAYVAAGVVLGNGTQEEFAELKAEVLQQSLNRQLNKLSQSDPSTARQLADRLRNLNPSGVAALDVPKPDPIFVRK